MILARGYLKRIPGDDIRDAAAPAFDPRGADNLARITAR